MSAAPPRYFCELDSENIVVRCIVAQSEEWCVEHLGGTWAETFMDTPGKRYAGIGFEYVREAHNFREPRPFASWSFDAATWAWVPPLPYPADDGDAPSVPRRWDEASQTWT
jgi:hypothetical protein